MSTPDPFDSYLVRRCEPTPIPTLPRGCGSWVVTSPNGKIFELFDRANVASASRAGWKIETAIDYLARVNAELRS